MKRKFTFEFGKWIFEKAEIEADSFDEAIEKAQSAFVATGAETIKGELLYNERTISNYEYYPGIDHWSNHTAKIKLIKETLKEE